MVHIQSGIYTVRRQTIVSLLDYDNDDFIPPGEVENWERRLGFKVPPT